MKLNPFDTPRLRVLLIAGLVIVGLGITVYAFRSKLGAAPLIGRWFQQADRGDQQIAYWTCPMHPHVKEKGPGKCPECGMDLIPVTKAAARQKEAASPQARPAASSAGDDPKATNKPAAPDPRAEVNIDPGRQQLMGIRTVPVKRASVAKTVRAVGLVRYDETRLADINLKLEGWIRDLYVDYTGEFVRRGQPLFTIYSPELVTTQNEYLVALKSREQLRQSQIADAREHAERLVESARQRLALWDLPADQIKALEETRQPQTAVVFRSPASGFVIEKQALKGMHVMPGQSLYKVADLSVVWVEADVYEQDMPAVRRGAQADVTLDAYPGERFSGRVIYVHPFVEEKTRAVKVRFEFPNRGNRLKPGMYANVDLRSNLGTGLTIPTNALLDSGTQQIVFVALGDGYFEPRQVRVGQRLENEIQILQGLQEGEQVATGATFFLDSESQLRASLQGFESPPAPPAAGAVRERLDIAFRSQPDPPQTGDHVFEVTVKDPDGKPVTDAEVTVAFFMPAMPTMNMPAMQNEAKLSEAGNGVYRGTGQVMMAGRWEVSVIVSRNGQRIGTKQLTVVAR
jgi:RND family efflux transporter MFP subunit